MKTPFLGPYGVERCRNAEDNQLINLYPRFIEDKDGKDVAVLYITPGLVLKASVGTGPIRGMSVFQGNLFVVSGASVYQLTPTMASTLIGTIASISSGPVSIISNERQLAIFDGINGYGYSAGSFSTISLPFSGPVSASYQDEFGVVNVSGTDQWYQSNAGDLFTWQGLNFASADTKPTAIVAIAESHNEQWLFKTDCVEVWINAGLATGFTFQRLPAVLAEVGCVAPFSVVRAGESLIWLSQSNEGQGQIMQAQGYNAVRISTHGIENQIQSYSKISDAQAYAYQQEGHTFYCITFPTGDTTFVYDVTSSRFAGQPIWHQRAAFLNGQFHRHWANSYAFFANNCLVGDYQNGNIYAYSTTAPLDNNSQRRWLRTWRAFEKPLYKPVKFPPLQIDMQSGISVPDGTNPLCCLRWSDDGGNTWGPELKQQVGPAGITAQRVLFRRLGSTRRGGGLDRIFELSSSDVFGVGLIGAEFLDQDQ